jgi:hypothetical protein
MTSETVTGLWKSFAPFAKRWDSKYDIGAIPDDDNSFLDELRREDTESKGIELFVRPYEEDTISPDKEAIIHLCQDASVPDLDQQDEESVWLDDRTHAAYFPDPTTSAQLRSSQNDGPTPGLYPDNLDERVLNNRDIEPAVHSSPITAGQSSPDSTFAKYSPASRRYLEPLTAKKLYIELKKKVIISIQLRTLNSYLGVRTLPLNRGILSGYTRVFAL